MNAAPTDDELRAVLARVRAMPRCAGWPADLATAMADPRRAALLRIGVYVARRGPAQRARAAARERAAIWRPAPRPPGDAPPLFDRKRAAAGERPD